jgi:hypothetical protein
MQLITTPWGRTLRLEVSRAAQRRLERRRRPLLLELELYFSCLVRKRVYVREQLDARAIRLTDHLQVRFRPVVTAHCAFRDIDVSNPPVRDMPAVDPERYFPHWLSLDVRRGEWVAEFGYATGAGRASV